MFKYMTSINYITYIYNLQNCGHSIMCYPAISVIGSGWLLRPTIWNGLLPPSSHFFFCLG